MYFSTYFNFFLNLKFLNVYYFYDFKGEKQNVSHSLRCSKMCRGVEIKLFSHRAVILSFRILVLKTHFVISTHGYKWFHAIDRILRIAVLIFGLLTEGSVSGVVRWRNLLTIIRVAPTQIISNSFYSDIQTILICS